MTGFGINVSRAAILVAGFVVCAFPAAAQGAAGTAFPATSAPPPTATRPRAAAPTVEVGSLGTPDGPPAGLLDAKTSGFLPEIWSGSPRDAVEDMLIRAPLATPIVPVQALARRLLLAVADAPLGQAPHAFQTVRIQALLNGGLVEEAGELAAKLRLKDDPEFAQVQAEAILLADLKNEACGPATETRLTDPDPFWMQLRAYCYAVAGEKDLLDLTRGVMKTQGTDDKVFESLLDDVLQHKSVAPAEIRDPIALEVFLMREAGLPVPPGFAAKFGLAASVLALRDEKNSPAARAEAAGQALHSGAVSAFELGTVADAQIFASDQLTHADTVSRDLPFFLGQALLRQAVARTDNDDVKLKLLVAALGAGSKTGLLPIAAGIQQPLAASIVPSPRMRFSSRVVTRALLLRGEADAAERWRDMLDPNSDADRALAAQLAVELYLVSPNAGRAARAQAALSWLEQNAVSLQPDGGPALQAYGALALGLYDALREAMPPSAKGQIAALLKQASPGRTIAPMVRNRLNGMLRQADQKGAALLTILDTIGAQGPGDLAPEATTFLVRALVAEKEPAAARAIAADALLLFAPIASDAL